jgi:hypothetical protein
MEMRCPGCQGRNVGKVGTGQFYCWDCFIEFSVSARGLKLYRVEADGELSRLDGQEAAGVVS